MCYVLTVGYIFNIMLMFMSSVLMLINVDTIFKLIYSIYSLRTFLSCFMYHCKLFVFSISF